MMVTGFLAFPAANYYHYGNSGFKLIIQVAETIFPLLVIAWVFELTPDGCFYQQLNEKGASERPGGYKELRRTKLKK
jgi:hypothetical protein